MDILNLKNNINIHFNNIIQNKHTCDNKLETAIIMVNNIKEQYFKLLKQISHGSFYLGIDSFNFQNKLLEKHLDFLKKNYTIILNRIYGDYYKIYKSIKKYIENNCNSIEILNEQVEVYKDLEIDKIYDFKNVIKLQNIINQYIKKLSDFVFEKFVKLQVFIDSNKIGYNVNYYITEEKTNLSIYNNNINLFLKYLDSCNDYHDKYFRNLLNQLAFFINYINNDILIDNYKKEVLFDKINEETNNDLDKISFTKITYNLDVESSFVIKDDNEVLNNEVLDEDKLLNNKVLDEDKLLDEDDEKLIKLECDKLAKLQRDKIIRIEVKEVLEEILEKVLI